MCSHDRPESPSSNPRVGIIKIHLIENVEKLGAKLRIDALLDFETLKKSHVKASQRRTVVSSRPDLTERLDIIDRECRRVETHRLICTRRGVQANACELSFIAFDGRE